MLDPILFVFCTRPLLDIVHHHSPSHDSFSDDNQLYKSRHISQVQDIIQSTLCCISDLKDWITNIKLQFNEDKTDMIPISLKKVLSNAPLPSKICLNGTNIKVCATKVSFLTDSFKKRINTICHYISEDALVLSRLDFWLWYCLG